MRKTLRLLYFTGTLAFYLLYALSIPLVLLVSFICLALEQTK